MLLRVLTYHRVASPEDRPWLHPGLISATPAEFDRQMDFLRTHYNPVSAMDVLNTVNGGKPLPGNPVLVTFDDGYRDFEETAWPVLQKHGVPATLFVPTTHPAQPETPFWWDELYHAVTTSPRNSMESPLGSFLFRRRRDRLSALGVIQKYIRTLPHELAMPVVESMCVRLRPSPIRHRRVLDWDVLRRLSKAGVGVASHSRSHPDLTRVTEAAAHQEVAGSKSDIRSHLGESLPLFCYPAGAFNTRTKDLVGKEGFRLAFTTDDGHNDVRSADLLALHRTRITARTSLPLFRLRLQRWFTYIESWRYRCAL